MSYQNILTQRVGRAALVTLNRPEKLNALSYELHRELDQELTLIENEQGVDVVILTGAGDRAFSSGGDIPQMASTTAEELAARREFHSKATWHIATFAKPIIGAITVWPTVAGRCSVQCWTSELAVIGQPSGFWQ